MPSIQEAPATLRRRAGSPSRQEHDSTIAGAEATSPIPATQIQTLLVEHSYIEPLARRKVTTAEGIISEEETYVLAPPSVTSRILNILFKPFHFLVFALLHIGLELMVSARTMKTLVQVFFLPHLFPVAPEVVRILRQDLDLDKMTKIPKHLAVVLPAGNESSESEEDEWAGQVAQLAQWATASGIKCLSIMRTDPLHPELVEVLQDRITDSIADFYREEKIVPVALARTLGSPEEGLNTLNPLDQRKRLHGGRPFDLDVVVLSKQDGHARLAGVVRTLGEAARQNRITSEDITTDFMDKELSYELPEPELLIILKDDLDMSGYPPWHIRLTEIFHHPDQAIIPRYTMFLQALHRYAKCDQRFGK
ncbi:hypothetical protein BGZ67_003105 [Mortierella alpina]|nr:hypothetical protein BGZ67_003105 [Mortierella alpina]